MLNRIAISGASGFIGFALGAELIRRGVMVRAAVRSLNMAASDDSGIEFVAVGGIGAETDWSRGVSGVDCVIHCAARAHVMHETESDALSPYRAVNVEGTRCLAEQAAAAGVQRLVYLSSVKVNGERTFSPHPSHIPKGDGKLKEFFSANDNPEPEDPYGISKWEAEEALHEVSEKTGLEVVIIRPPLVYGPGVKGNFLSMLGWLSRGVPLPLGAIKNQRSLVGIDNLVDLLITCIDHPAAANQTFLVSDDEDLSTTELLRRLGAVLGKPARLVPVPASLLELAGRLVGKQDIAQRLLGNLRVDISKTREMLDWAPPVSVDEGLSKTAEWFLNKR